MKKKPTVTICVPAYNEERTLRSMLLSLLDQKQRGFVMEKIIVASDGSSDSTVKVGRSVKSKLIYVNDDRNRKGRTYRLNWAMKTCKTDILIFLDADLVINDQLLVSKLVEPFVLESKVMLVGGSVMPYGKPGFLTKSLILARNAYVDIRHRLNGGHNIYGCMGGNLAIAKPLYENVQIPEDVVSDDSYLYLSCVTNGYEFRHVPNAEVLHPLPETIKQQVSRNRRFSLAGHELNKYFGPRVDEAFFIPRLLYVKSMIKQVVRYPLHTIFVYTINTYSRYLAKKQYGEISNCEAYD